VRRTATTFCRFCIAACGLRVTLDDNIVTGVTGDRDHPLSSGYTCEKGRAIGQVESSPDRLAQPTIVVGGNRRAVDPDAAIGDLAARIAEIERLGGPDAVALYQGNGAGFDTTAWAAGRWFARAVGTRNRFTSLTLDAIAKPYVSTLMSGIAPLVPHAGADVPALTLIVGANPVVSHGHTAAFADPVRRLRRWARHGPLWVVDPRRTETAALATHHVACRPGTDHLFLAAVLRRLLDTGPPTAPDDPPIAGVDELVSCVGDVDDSVLRNDCDVDPSLADELARAVERAGRLLALSGTGSTMSPAGNLVEWMLLATLVVTGSIERPGGAWFNPGFFGEVLRSPSADRRPPIDRRPTFGQRPCAELVEAIESGEVRCLICVGGNPLRAFPDSARAAAALARLDVLAVVDVVRSELTDHASHVLPSPTQLERTDINLPSELAQPIVIGQYTAALRRRAAGFARGGGGWPSWPSDSAARCCRSG
jgi:anaerobic selenocysteine-containing dehydrogenase